VETPKLKQKDLPSLREGLLEENGGICPICQEPLSKANAALDHCHKTGYVRNTIHKDCNILLGKIENYIFTRGARLRDIGVLSKALQGIVPYMTKDYTAMPFHPKHKTPKDKQLLQLRRRLRAAKRDETKARLKAQIKDLQSND